MQTLRVIGCVGLIGLLLCACSWSVRKPSVPAQKNGENTAATQTPEVVEPEQSSKTSTQEKPSQEVAIADLANRNYQFCTEPPKTPTDDEDG